MHDQKQKINIVLPGPGQGINHHLCSDDSQCFHPSSALPSELQTCLVNYFPFPLIFISRLFYVHIPRIEFVISPIIPIPSSPTFFHLCKQNHHQSLGTKTQKRLQTSFFLIVHKKDIRNCFGWFCSPVNYILNSSPSHHPY